MSRVLTQSMIAAIPCLLCACEKTVIATDYSYDATISGVVRDADGSSVAGAETKAWQHDDGWESAAEDIDTTDAEGRYALTLWMFASRAGCHADSARIQVVRAPGGPADTLRVAGIPIELCSRQRPDVVYDLSFASE